MKKIIPIFLMCWIFLIFKKSIGQNSSVSKNTIVNSNFNPCQQITFPLNLNINNYKEIPHTIIKNTKNFFLLAYNDISPITGTFIPYFRITDRYQNPIAGYSFSFENNFFPIDQGNIYLTDITEIDEESGSIFITGFLNPINKPHLLQCISFVARINLFNGNIQQIININDQNIIFNNILYDKPNDQILLVGEKFRELISNPIEYTGTSQYNDIKRDAIAISLKSYDLNQFHWKLEGYPTVDSSDVCLGSSFEKIIITPFGYFLTGKKIVPDSGAPVNIRTEAVSLDFNGNVQWQKSFYLSNFISRGVSAFYANGHERIFLLFQSSFYHSFGLIALNPNNGQSNNYSIFSMGPETNMSDITNWPDMEDVFTVGGAILDPTTQDFSPFWLNFSYNLNSDSFYFSPSLNYSMKMTGGINYTSTTLAPYFSWDHYSFSMFTADKREFPPLISTSLEPSFLFSTKNSSNNSVNIYKMNFDHCDSCDYEWIFPDINVYPNVLGMPLKIVNSEIEIQEKTEYYFLPDLLDCFLTCGTPDSTYHPPFYTSGKIDNFENFVDSNGIIVFDVLGKKLFEGSYELFLIRKEKLQIFNKIIFIYDRENQKTIKRVFLK